LASQVGCIARARESDADELALRFGIRGPVGGELRGEFSLEFNIGMARLGMVTQVVSEEDFIDPELAARLDQVQVVGARFRGTKEEAAIDAICPEICIPKRFDEGHARRGILERVDTDHDIEDWLGRKSRDGRASDMFNSAEPTAAGIFDSFGLHGEEDGPTGVVIDDENAVA